ncbi:MAG: magnesium transporter [Clostridia bacterium]
MDFDILFELLKKKNIKELRPILEAMNPSDIALFLENVEKEELPIVFRLLPKDTAADTFVEMDSDMQELLITSFSDRELKVIIDELFIDDTVDIIEEMPANVVKRILNFSAPESRKVINEILQYPEDSAGSIMTIEYVRLHRDMTVRDAFATIRKTGVDKETIYTCYVTDDKKYLQGIVTAKELLLNDQNTKIEDIMETNLIYVDTQTDKEEVANHFQKYNFLAMPVVDQEKRLVGIVTIDDALDVISAEGTEDISKIAALTSIDTDTPYLKTSVFSIFKSRVFWLMLLMISATLTGLVISSNETVLSNSMYGLLLTACIPMITGTGGNAGSQASVTVIRSIALGDLKFKDLYKVIWKELRVSILLGIVLASVCFIKLMLVDGILQMENGALVGMVICLTMFFTVVLAKLIGCTLPLVAKQIHLDPAVVASPFISTIVDTLSLLIFCAIAMAVL